MPTLAHILVVDDDPAMRELIGDYLSEHDFRVTSASNGAEMAAALQAHALDLVILDLKLPDGDGAQIARRMRETSTLPIIVVTGRLDEADRVMALELGADDYLTKPFSLRELLARIRTVLRRSSLTAATAITTGRSADARAYRFDGWELNTGTRRLVSPSGEAIVLTNGEFSLLTAFLAAPGHILTRDQLLEASRMYDDVFDRSIDVQILRLRRKIEADPSNPRYIKTVRGAGYMFFDQVEKIRSVSI